jgi:hypothetical protein
MRSIGMEPDPDGLEPAVEAPPAIGTDERRMHVRAYNFWVSMLGDKAYPSIEDLDPAEASDFGPHSVLLDFTGGLDNPAVAYLGDALRLECGMPHHIHAISDVPSRSLLSRLTDHYLQILANRAPIGFEAEFVSQRGHNTLYRGILMPYSSDDDTIDFVYGVINWKELAEPDVATELVLEIEHSIGPSFPSVTPADGPLWADGPAAEVHAPPPLIVSGAGNDDDPIEDGEDAAFLMPGHNAALADHLAAARDLAEQAQGARLKSRAALYRALGLAYDFALLSDARPAEYAELLADAGIKTQSRAPMTAVVKLVFGMNVDKARATEFAATLAQAQRLGLGAGTLADHIDMQPGGLKAMVAAERTARKPASAPPSHAEIARAALRKVAPRALLDLPSDPGEFVLLLARREDDGRLAVIAPVPEEATLLDRAIRKITR